MCKQKYWGDTRNCVFKPEVQKVLGKTKQGSPSRQQKFYLRGEILHSIKDCQ